MHFILAHSATSSIENEEVSKFTHIDIILKKIGILTIYINLNQTSLGEW